MRAEDSHRNDRRESFCDDKPDPGLGWLEISIERPRALGKNKRAMIGSQDTDDRLERAAIPTVLVDRNDVELGQEPAEHREVEEAFAREKINRAPAPAASKWGIEITLVIHRQNDRAFLKDTFRMNDAKLKKDSRDETREMVNREVPGIHCAIVRPLRFNRPMISPTTPSIVRLELSMTCASSAIIKGEARREESASSRALI